MITTYNLVCEELDKVYEWAKDVDFGSHNSAGYDTGSDERTVNIRFDAETPVYDDPAMSLSAAFSYVRDDLMDLVTNGDVHNVSDPLLKSFDGEQKNGKRLSKISISQARIYREYRPVQSRYEYTLYLVVYVEFNG